MKKSRRFYIFVFLAPAVLIYSLFMIYPLADSLRLSFFTETDSGEEVFAGLANFVKLFTNDNWRPRYWGAFKNNIVFFILHMLIQNPIGLLLASLLAARKLRGRLVFRTVLFLPTTLSVVVIGFVWQLILSPLWGISSSFLGTLGLEELFRPWLGQENSALITLSLISVWQFVGIPMMLFYAALIGIPGELYEAAQVDGAGSWKIFWRIKIPVLMPIIGVVMVLTFIGNFNAFDLIYVTQGVLAGPSYSTDILGTFFYRTFFGQQLLLGNPTMGATIAAMMFLTILAGVLAYTHGYRKRVETYEL